MKIEELRKIRNKNVQQQNQLKYLEMKECAGSFKTNPVGYPWLVELLSSKGKAIDSGLLIECHDVPEQFGTQWIGTWLSNDKRFYEFDVIADRSTNKLIEIDEWKEFNPEISANLKGIGKSSAYIALELLSEFVKS